ncbi:unnamed protein product [Rhodiola kirilowii]
MDDSCAVNASELKVLCLACYTYPNIILINTPSLSTVSLEMRVSGGDQGDPDMLDFFLVLCRKLKTHLNGGCPSGLGVLFKRCSQNVTRPT